MSRNWIKALTQPTVESFEQIAANPRASSWRALSWIFVSLLIGSIIYIVLGSIFGGIQGTLSLVLYNTPLIVSLFIISLAVLLGLIILASYPVLTQLLARLFGGAGSFSELFYAYSAFISPLSVISYTISAIPVINCLALPLGLYGFYIKRSSHKSSSSARLGQGYSFWCTHICATGSAFNRFVNRISGNVWEVWPPRNTMNCTSPSVMSFWKEAEGWPKNPENDAPILRQCHAANTTHFYETLRSRWLLSSDTKVRNTNSAEQPTTLCKI